MTLVFEFKRAFGRPRVFPKGPEATALLAVFKRQSLSLSDLERLEAGGISVRVDFERSENVPWR